MRLLPDISQTSQWNWLQAAAGGGEPQRQLSEAAAEDFRTVRHPDTPYSSAKSFEELPLTQELLQVPCRPAGSWLHHPWCGQAHSRTDTLLWHNAQMQTPAQVMSTLATGLLTRSDAACSERCLRDLQRVGNIVPQAMSGRLCALSCAGGLLPVR